MVEDVVGWSCEGAFNNAVTDEVLCERGRQREEDGIEKQK